jgi:energy-converting hydrogenase B subunit D
VTLVAEDFAASVGRLPLSWAVNVLQVTLFLLVAAGATAVVLCRRPTRQVVFLSAYGVLLSLLFFSVQAPDVTLSALTIGAVVLPLLLLLGLAKIEERPR